MRFICKHIVHTPAGELRAANVGQSVKIAGWVHRNRNLGNLCFVDLRDHYGITQCVVDSSSDLFAKVEALRPESVVGFSGKVIIARSGYVLLSLGSAT